MTIQEIITLVDRTKPNAFTAEDKLRWISQLDGQIGAQVLLLAAPQLRSMAYTYPADLTSTPLLDPPHDAIYPLWLAAQIDLHNGEYTKYANSLEVYNNAYGAFVRWFANTYEPAQGYETEA